jgi:hypothetical protein
MNRRILPGKLLLACAFVVFGSLSARAVAAAAPAPLNIEVLGKGTVPLDGDWQFVVDCLSATSGERGLRLREQN